MSEDLPCPKIKDVMAVCDCGGNCRYTATDAQLRAEPEAVGISWKRWQRTRQLATEAAIMQWASKQKK